MVITSGLRDVYNIGKSKEAVHVQSDLKNVSVRNGTMASFSIPVSILFCDFLLRTKYFFFHIWNTDKFLSCVPTKRETPLKLV